MNENAFNRILNLSKNCFVNEKEEEFHERSKIIYPQFILNTYNDKVLNNTLISNIIIIIVNNTYLTDNSMNKSRLANNCVFNSNLKSTSHIYTSKVGFYNLKNTCYLNTSLQCLLHSKRFTSEFIKNFNCKSDTISYELNRIISKILKKSEDKPFKSKSFLEKFSNKHEKFKGHVQHDAQEFFRILIEDISNDFNKVKEIPNYNELQLIDMIKVQANEAFHYSFLERENSIMVDLFYCQVCNIFICEKCNFSTNSFEKIMDIPILLEEVKIYDLFDLLNLYFKDDVIQWDRKCESKNCNFKGNHIKSTRLTILPQILIITFQRYNYRSKRKNSSKIIFEPTLDIYKFVDKDCLGKGKSTRYNLFAVSNHLGTIDFGHYFAYFLIYKASYCKIENSWYEFNDSEVTNIIEISFESCTVYTLFYELEEY